MQNPPGGQIVGAALKSWIDNLESHVTDTVFERYGFSASALVDDKWYDGEILDAMWRELYALPGGPQTLVAIGKASATTTMEALQPKDIADFLARMPYLFTTFIRGVLDEYGFHSEWISDTQVRVTNKTNLPNDHLYGWLWEVMRLLSQGQRFVVKPVSGYYPHSTEGAVFEIELG